MRGKSTLWSWQIRIGMYQETGVYLELQLIFGSFRVFDLKEKLYTLTSVPFERQKILGLVKGKLPADEATMYGREQLQLKPSY